MLAKCRITTGNFHDFVGGQHIRQYFSVACNPDSEILALLQTAETVVCIHKTSFDADNFPMFSVGWTWQGFYRDLDPCGFE